MEEKTKQEFNEVSNLTAICRSTDAFHYGTYPELEIGKTYHVTHIAVFKSSSEIILQEFGDKVYLASCFDIYENGHYINHSYTKDIRFWTPSERESNDYLSEHRSTFIESQIIPSHLLDIEHEYNVKVLLAVESGSRAWGFESKNSDWDVRFIYVHKPEWYFSVEEKRDVIEHMYEDDIDLVGWELRKALSLLRKNNPSILEWLNSPIIYCMDQEFGKRIRDIAYSNFNPIRSMYHYHHVYNKHNERYLQKEGYPMKRFLYYLRGILACKWIEMHKTLPPVPFRELVEATVKDRTIIAKIDDLIRIKRGEKECDMLIIDPVLVDYARRLANYYNEYVDSFRPTIESVSSEPLDTLLYDIVNK